MRRAIIFYSDFRHTENYSKNVTFDWVTNLGKIFYLSIFDLVLLQFK